MNILHLGKFYAPSVGGMERVLQELAVGSRGEADISVLVANTAPRTVVETVEGVRVVRAANLGSIWSLPICPTLPAWLGRLPADLAVLHVPNPLAMQACLNGRAPRRLIVWVHSDIVRHGLVRPWYEATLRRCLARAQAAVVSSPPMLALPVLQAHQAKCRVIPYAVDLARFTLTPARQQRAASLRAQYGSPVILCVGRLTYYKGVTDLIAAMAGVAGTLLVVGTGPEAPALRRQVRRLGLTGRVHFLGAVDDETLAACYHACDCAVLPSVTRSEAFGLVQLEAMAAGKPVISTNLPTGVPWVTRDGVTGLVVPPRAPAMLARALARLLADAALRERLGAQGRRRVEQDFTIPRMIGQMAALCRSVV